MENTQHIAAAAAEEITKPLPTPETNPEFHSRFINRDLSLLEFTKRVLDEAFDETQPLLERLKFISIVSSNLDEFFMIRVSGLQEKLGHEVGVSLDGITTPELLEEIKVRVVDMTSEQMACLTGDILPALAREGIEIAPLASLSESERHSLNE
ncbi:MAG: RNA degradosome polyphosphate kinase, partial [Acidobacteriota bacterium]